MTHDELMEEVARDMCDYLGAEYEKNPSYWNGIAENTVSKILTELQEPTSRMLREFYIVQDDVASVNPLAVPSFRDYWYAVINVSPIAPDTKP